MMAKWFQDHPGSRYTSRGVASGRITPAPWNYRAGQVILTQTSARRPPVHDYDDPQILSAGVHPERPPGGPVPFGGTARSGFSGALQRGKSTLINNLLGRKKLVRTSSRPGCTRALNFFLINQRWNFVDLPGFGYARCPGTSRRRGDPWCWTTWPGGSLWRRWSSPGWPQASGLRGVVPLGIFKGARAPGDPGPDQGRQTEAGGADRQLNLFAAAVMPYGVDPGEVIWFSALSREGRSQLWERLLGRLEGA